MLSYDHGDEFEMVERGDTMFQSTEVFVKSAGMGAHGGGGLDADWAQWGRPNAKDTLLATAKAKEDERKRSNAEKDARIAKQEAEKQEAMTEAHSQRLDWIRSATAIYLMTTTNPDHKQPLMNRVRLPHVIN